MGKGRSPGKWFKNLLLGKKSSAKSTSSKKNDIFKPSSNKDVVLSSEVPVSDSPVNSLVISPPISGANDTKGVLSEKEVVSKSSHDNNVLSTGDEEAKVKDVTNFETQEDPEKLQLTEAAIKVQAACRSYLARRTFQTLKGAIQLQALIRGHLVRRQAVSALYCVKGIVKFQALARGYNVRRSDIGHAVQKICKDTHCSNSILVVSSAREEKVSENVFVCKLLASSPYAVPLSLTSDPGEPNFGWKWLEYWTLSHFWAPHPVLKKKSDSLSDEKNGSSQTVQRGQVKRTTRKSPAVKGDNGSVLAANRSKQRPKKDSSHPLPSAQEHPQKETEKSSLEKKLALNVSNGSEVVNEKRKNSSRKILDHSVTDVLEQVPNASSEKMEDLTVAKSEESDPGKGHAQPAKDENCNEPHNDPISVSRTSVKKGENEKNQGVGEDQNGGDDNCISNNCQRRASLPANFNDQDGEVYATPVTPRLPSYMAPTESAKAKLRGQNSPRFATDLVEKSSTTRRHSLSSSLNGRSGSFSPRAERLMAVSGRGVIKSDRSLSSSRDGTEKLIQPQWRR
ncbi:protein IQ-DOMAIN 31 isoform X1 [Vigna radiata var. radiata]|uniref:Protein IQ-DOMAIN 31 isoform X1 n=1 Tax=Vigna radiata var. radiata TaxID=3916 RepID=A0A1S3VSP9_VIGRR|nr:protein IQ-DOMAIN 31 isoform X1 [Vigna radiata var. radiata]XP_014521334.1 protein IQ-DOMAIN 31 isoform X1 [Vigna radiata var. radiata]XP_014521335.1 protein IQ-DOMAIN 31 isoform X1 [Vigna radiata var. radiata]XP_022643238.1 protein IQ-DOMAIN 31 isoform X1 [Vigna radiata var. radiata]